MSNPDSKAEKILGPVSCSNEGISILHVDKVSIYIPTKRRKAIRLRRERAGEGARATHSRGQECPRHTNDHFFRCGVLYGSYVILASNMESGRPVLYFTFVMKRWVVVSPFRARMVMCGVRMPCTGRKAS